MILDKTASVERQAAVRIAMARSELIRTEPFFGCLVMHMRVRDVGDVIPTMATNGRDLLYNPKFVMTLSDPELVGVCAHEALHVAYLHHVRRGTREHIRYNVACDFAVNRDLIACGFTLPKSRLYDPKYDGMTSEMIYTLLPETQYISCGFGEVKDAEDPQQAQDEAEKLVRTAVMAARAAGQGRVPTAIARMLGQIEKGRIGWKEILRQFADDSQLCDFTWSRPNRRFVGMDIILPGVVSVAPSHIVCIVDTSGSMSVPSLKALIGEIQEILDDDATDKVTVVYCDAAVHRVEEYNRGDRIEPNPVGGGGTDFAPGFKWVKENVARPSGILYMTDMECSSWGEQPLAPVLWCCIGGRPKTPPFGRVIEVDPYS